MAHNASVDGAPSLFRMLCRQITLLRRYVANLLFLLLLVLIFGAVIGSCSGDRTPTSNTLLINPTGVLVDSPPRAAPWAALLPSRLPSGTSYMPTILRAMDYAADDPAIERVVLDLGSVQQLSQGQAERLGFALDRLKAQGKRVLIYSYGFDQNTYLLASHSDEVALHPMGQALFTGIGLFGFFIKDFLDRFNVDVDIFRVGELKSATETFTRNNMSDAVKAEYRQLSDDLWQRWITRVAENRGVRREQITDYIDNFSERLQATRGDLARVALEAELVDELITEDEFLTRLAQDPAMNAGQLPAGLDYRSYLSNSDDPIPATAERYIGVLTLEGTIVMDAPQGTAIGARQTVDTLRQLREDPKLAGLIVRINSPGGSSVASELIRAELELLQLADRPVVISMADTVASGGYWISSTADRVFAEPTTVTGSIGVFSIVPSFPRALDKLGVHVDGVGSTRFAGGLSPVLGVNDAMAEVLNLSVQSTYRAFRDLVARGRSLSLEAVEAIADGRVLLGPAAIELGLVDEAGSLNTAIDSLAAELGLDREQVRRIMPTVDDDFDRLASMLSSNQSLSERLTAVANEVLENAWARAHVPLDFWTWDDPRSVYALCTLCPVPGTALLQQGGRGVRTGYALR
ncbi:MAG: signal peptide peptidase SppA [Pseudomonadota bacterium]